VAAGRKKAISRSASPGSGGWEAGQNIAHEPKMIRKFG
jgi:hypothetical protein